MSHASSRAIWRRGGLHDGSRTTNRYAKEEFSARGLTDNEDHLIERSANQGASLIGDIGTYESHGEMKNGGVMTGRLLLAALKRQDALVEGYDPKAVLETMREIADEIEPSISERIVDDFQRTDDEELERAA